VCDGRHVRWRPAWLAAAVSVGLIAACGSSEERPSRFEVATESGGAGGGAGQGGNAGGAQGGSIIRQSDAGPEDADLSEVTNLSLLITGQAASVQATGAASTVQLNVTFADGSKPNSVLWTVDDTRIGSVDQTGLFRAKGYVAGTTTVTAQVASQKVSFDIKVTVDITENPDNVPANTMTALAAGGSGDATFKWLHPYDKTVFPWGLTPPLLQFGGTAADFTYIKVTVGDFSYKGYFANSGPTRITLPQKIWDGATLSTGASDWLTAEVAKSAGGAVAGPVTEKWRVAQGNLKGIVYYNTYDSPLTNMSGGIMQIKPGTDATVAIGGCTVCHSVSSKGNVIASAQGPWAANNPSISSTWDTSPTAAPATRYTGAAADGRMFTFGGLTPDGAMIMVDGIPSNWPMPRGLSPAPTNGFPSRLVDTKTGIDVTTTGWTNKNALTPAFSHDGKAIAFSNRTASQSGHILSVMDFDGASVFSNARNVVTLSPAARVAAWPSWLPDAKAVVFQNGESYDTIKWVDPAKPFTAPNRPETYADINLVDLSSSNAVINLGALNGYADDGTTLYLPYPAAEEKDMNYEPTVLPVPVGGFYWVMFTSRRCYGNEIAPEGTVANGQYPFFRDPAILTVDKTSARKKLWIAAIDMDYAGKADPSHPAFYLPGQELEAGNMRAFAALEPCKADGASCESGAECCNGFCRQTGTDDGGIPVLQCVPPPPNSCSNIDEVCNTSGDCCKADWICVNGRCALPPPEPPK
jgi:hypothetical protein